MAGPEADAVVPGELDQGQGVGEDHEAIGVHTLTIVDSYKRKIMSLSFSAHIAFGDKRNT